MSPLPPGLQPGELVDGKYRVDRVLGRGGMGLVLAAMHEQLEQPVALKVLRSDVAQPDIVMRFLREARAAVKIHSEHVARVFDVGTLPSGLPYIVMELLQGEDLSQLLRSRGLLDAEEAVGIVLEASEAIAEAHALGIIHRDIKPANLFLTQRPSGRPIVKVLDFGISKIPSKGGEQVLTGAMAIIGSPQYMSPEQMIAARDVDARSDIWSLGVVLYELLTGAVPFSAPTMPEVVAAILAQPPRPISELRPDVPLELQKIVSHCLEKEPENRYLNLTALVRELAPFGGARHAQSVERVCHLLGDDPPTVRADRLGSAPLPEMRASAPSMPMAAGASIAAPAARRSSWLWTAALFLVVAVVAAVATLVFSGPKTPLVATPPAGVVPSAAATDAAMPSAPSLAPSDLEPLESPVAPATANALSSAPSAVPMPPRPSTPRPRPALGKASASSAPASSAPACHTESFFDRAGNKHFKQVCL
jgi:serine/threonine-protein kinase